MQMTQQTSVFPPFQMTLPPTHNFPITENFKFHQDSQKKKQENHNSDLETKQKIKWTELEIKGPIRYLSQDLFKVHIYLGVCVNMPIQPAVFHCVSDLVCYVCPLVGPAPPDLEWFG